MQKIEFSVDTFDLYKELNRPTQNRDEDSSIQSAFENQVAKTPDRVALVCGSERRSYSELNARANAIAHLLVRRGVTKGSMVAISYHRSIGMIENLIAIVKCGAAYVPLDSNWPESRLRMLLEEVDCKLAIAGSSEAAKAISPWSKVLEFNSSEYQDKFANPPTNSDLHTTAYVNFTSGSTGTPKGVPIPHVGVLRLVQDAIYAPLNQETRTLQMAPIAFDAATFEIWGPLLNGGTCVLYDKDAIQLTDMTQQILAHDVNTLFLTTALFNTIIDVAPQTLANVDHVLTGGEAHSVRHMVDAFRLFGPNKISSVYGPTECTTFSSFFPINTDPSESRSIPIGTPIQETGIYILDGDRACDVGEPGVIHITGAGLANGYTNDIGRTALRFRTVMIDGLPERMYDTGDFGQLNQNLNIEFLGREDDQVKVNGFRIELGEISGHLNSLDGVQQSYVTTTKSPSGETKLVAFVLVNGQATDIGNLRTALSTSLPEYMIPQLIPRTSPFPLTATNKIDKNALLSTLSEDRNRLKKSAANIQEYIAKQGMDAKVIELAATTRTAMDAAHALNCDITHIVKSLVFRTRDGKKPVIVLASGPNRVDVQRIAAIVGEPIERATPDFVRETTGFAIGGVPPIGHKVQSLVIVDQDLIDLVGVWAAAGTPNAVFQVSRPITDILNNYRVATIKEKV